MTVSSNDSRPHTLQRALCVAVVLIVVITAIYAAWIWIANFSRIGV